MVPETAPYTKLTSAGSKHGNCQPAEKLTFGIVGVVMVKEAVNCGQELAAQGHADEKTPQRNRGNNVRMVAIAIFLLDLTSGSCNHVR